MQKDTIYVTDDDPGIRELVAEYLAGQGYAVETAEDAAALDRLLAARLPELLVLDWMMPGEDGLSIARRLRDYRSPRSWAADGALEQAVRCHEVSWY